MADWEIFELIIFHLITNAVKYSNTGGNVIVKLSLSHDPLQLSFMVRDRGVGMSEEKLARVKTELEQSLNVKKIVQWEGGNPETNTELGFGLSTANMLISLLTGQLELTSLPWYKTEAKFTIPVKLGSDSPSLLIFDESSMNASRSRHVKDGVKKPAEKLAN